MTDRSSQRWRQLADSPLDDRIDAVCDDFEQAWISGDCPELSTYLPRVEPTDRSLLFRELLLVDVEYRRRLRQPRDKSAYLHGYPEFAAELETVDKAIHLDQTSPGWPAAPVRPRRSSGQLIGRFELLQKVGAGAGGEVWKAHDHRLRRIVAVKIAHAGADDGRHRFVREGQAVAQLRHPHIVAVHDAWHDEDAAYLVADFYDGADLKCRLARKPISARQAAETCATIADALQYAHQCGVIHRDLKPANILLDENEVPHIADFGLAKWDDDAKQLTLHGQLLGTVAYMSPEQARGDSVAVDARTDVYSLGIMLYEMLTGECPHVGDQSAVLLSILTVEPAPPRTRNRAIPRDLETICLKAIECDAARRYASAGEMAADLRRYLRGEPVLARRRGVLSRLWRYLRRRPAGAACVVLGLAALGAMLAVQGMREKQRELLGIRKVTLATEPEGARVVFVPLSKTTLEPIPSELMVADGLSPVTQELAPGDYLVVVALDDGRFHEVVRHVPMPGDVPANFADAGAWSSRPDGGIDIRTVKIPPATVTDDMALIEVKSAQATSFSERRRGREFIRSFYVDTHEFSNRQKQEADSVEYASLQNPNHPALVTYAKACALAELVGKRLPSAAEYEYVATGGDAQKYSWGNDAPATTDDGLTAEIIGPVGAPQFDRSTIDRRIAGLCSNVAEWTTSVAPGVDAGGNPIVRVQSQADMAADYRIVKGGWAGTPVDGPTAASAWVDPRINQQVRIDSSPPAIGLRCYRSVRPHLTPEDFETPAPLMER